MPSPTSLPTALARCGRAGLTVATLAVGLAAAPAHAALPTPATIVSADYAASFDGVYHYIASEGDPGGMDASRTMNIAWHSDSAQPITLARTATQATSVSETLPPSTTLDGEYHETIYSEPPTHQDCTLAQDGPAQKGIVGASTDDKGVITVDFEPFQRLDGKQTCSRPVTDPNVAFLGSGFSRKVTVPVGDLGAPTITIPVQSDASLPCPSYGLTLTCDVEWTGQITLTLRHVVTQGGSAATPTTPTTTNPGGGTVTPATPKPASGQDSVYLPPLTDAPQHNLGPDAVAGVPPAPRFPNAEDPGVPYVGRGGDMVYDPVHGVLVFVGGCTGGCDGTATIATTPAGGRAAAASSRPMIVRFEVAASRTLRTVRVRLTKRARTAVGHAGHAKVTVTLRDRASHEAVHASKLLGGAHRGK